MQKNPTELFIFGEVLFDHFPGGEKVLGGAPFNVAWHCQAFGLQPTLISRIGCDEEGDEIVAAMQEWGMTIRALQRDEEHPTGKVEVSFDQEEPSYDIVADSAWDFIEHEQMPDFSNTSLLYHGSLAFRQAVSHRCLHRLLNSACKRFVDVNLRPPWWDKAQIQKMLDGASWVKLNRQEQQDLNVESVDAELILTAGEKGAEWISVGDKRLSVMPDNTMTVVDSVGAGDAFCSVVLLGIFRQWPIKQTMKRAQQFASAVVGIRGATSRNAGFYQQFIDQWAQP